MRNVRILTLVFILCLVLFGCDKDEEVDVLDKIILVEDYKELIPGEHYKIKAYTSITKNTSFSYSSSDYNVVTVDDSGNLVAITSGNAEIAISNSEETVKLNISVVADSIPVQSISISETYIETEVDMDVDGFNLNPIIEPKNATNSEVFYEVTGNGITISDDGYVNVNTSKKSVNEIKVYTRNGVSSVCQVVVHGKSISTIEEFMSIGYSRENLTKDYRLVNDLDFSNYSANYIPLGSEMGFYGTFDGNGHVIKNINSKHVNVYSNQQYLGVFGIVYGSVKNLAISNISIESNRLNVSAGAICGELYGSVDSCYATGDILLSSTAGNDKGYLGGLVGKNNGQINDSYSLVNIEARNNNIYSGGLVGVNAAIYKNGGTSAVVDYGKISNCISLGSVVTTNGSSVTSLNEGTINNVYYSSAFTNSKTGVISNKNIANIRDLTFEELVNNNSLELSEKWTNDSNKLPILKNINGQDYISELVNNDVFQLEIKNGEYKYDLNKFLNLDNSIYSNATWTSSNESVANVTGNNIIYSYLNGTTTLTGKFLNGQIVTVNLTVNLTGQFSGGFGSFDKPYEIISYEQLRNISSDLGSGYILKNDITSLDESWIPLGDNTDTFVGMIDGNGYKISGLSITKEHVFVGLVGGNNGMLKNISLENIYYKNNTAYIGGLVGVNYQNGIIDGAYISGLIYSNQNAGGAACENYGKISNVIVATNIIGAKGSIGGVCQSNFEEIRNCVVLGALKASNVGNIVAVSNSTNIYNCYYLRTNVSNTNGGVGNDKYDFFEENAKEIYSLEEIDLSKFDSSAWALSQNIIKLTKCGGQSYLTEDCKILITLDVTNKSTKNIFNFITTNSGASALKYVLSSNDVGVLFIDNNTGDLIKAKGETIITAYDLITGYKIEFNVVIK